MRKSYQWWLPWLGLYTGARLEELCQFHLDDIRQVGDIWVFDINAKDEKRLKTLSSERLVPIHPKLVELGLRPGAFFGVGLWPASLLAGHLTVRFRAHRKDWLRG